MNVSEGEFKGKPTISFKRDEEDKFPVTFGVRKCKVILEHIAEIQDFYERNKHTLKAASVCLMVVLAVSSSAFAMAKGKTPFPEPSAPAPRGNFLDLREESFVCNDKVCDLPVRGILINCNLDGCKPITNVILPSGPVKRVAPVVEPLAK